MKVLIVKRKYLALILFIASILVNWLVTIGAEESRNYIFRHEDEKNKEFFNNNPNASGDQYVAWRDINNMDEQRRSVFTYSGLLQLLSLVFYVFILYFYLKKRPINNINKAWKYLLIILLLLVLFMLVGGGGFKIFYNHSLYVRVCILTFYLPYLYFIWKETFIGEVIDQTDTIIQNKANALDENITSLEKLKKANIISEEQFIAKVELSKRDKIRTEFLLSEEYKVLYKLKNQGVFTEDEFIKKIEEIITKRI